MMDKEFEINGCVMVSPDDDFWEAFIDFVESKGWFFGGGIEEIVDGYYVLADGSRGKHVMEDA